MTEDAAVYELHRGNAPLLVGVPHCATLIPDPLLRRMVPRVRSREDTDWYLDQIYAFVVDLGASLLVPRYSRYVIDLNRPPDDASLYAGANTTGLCPVRFFSGEPLYVHGAEPDDSEIAERRSTYWRPYHDALRDELARLKKAHGHAVLLDGHSIKPELPWLFDGRLPDLNLGTANGVASGPALHGALTGLLQSQKTFTHVTDGRFKGGYITRHYGRPKERLYAVQLEMSWSCYLAELRPYRIDPTRANRLAPFLRSLVQTLIDWRPADD